MVEIEGETYLNVAEATALLGVKPATLYTYVSRGVLRSYRQAVGRQRLYRRADVLALLELRSNTAATAEHAVRETPASYAVSSADTADSAAERTLRDVELPNAETWAGEH